MRSRRFVGRYGYRGSVKAFNRRKVRRARRHRRMR